MIRRALSTLALAALPCCAHAPPRLTVAMEPTGTSNNGRALYVVARVVTPAQFAAQDYRTVSALVEAPDSTVRARVVVLPGRAAQAAFEVGANDRVAIYGFFSDVGGQWRVLLDPPNPTQLRLRITTNSLEILPDGR